MSSTTSQEPPGYLAARVELLALRATFDEPLLVDVDRYSIAPADKDLTADEAAKLLALMAKPLSCRAEVKKNSFNVFCEEIVDPTRLKFHTRISEDLAGGLISDLHEKTNETDPLVLIFGGRDSILVNLTVVTDWLRNYLLPGSGALEPAGKSWAKGQPAAILRLGKPGRILPPS